MTIQRRSFHARLLALLGSITMGAATHAKANPDVLLAHNAPAGIDPTGYLVSEKLVGVRALWDGSTLRFRSGRPVGAPAWFLAKLPGTPLDGELWMGRGTFDALSGAVRRAQPVDAEWAQLKYMVFELPAAGSFTQRREQLQSITQGRSDVLLKLKPVQDAEAVVVGHTPGQGKYAGHRQHHHLPLPRYDTRRQAPFCQFFARVCRSLTPTFDHLNFDKH